MVVGEKMRPREKAPRMFAIDDPKMLPIASEDCRWDIAAITTISYKIGQPSVLLQELVDVPHPIQRQRLGAR